MDPSTNSIGIYRKIRTTPPARLPAVFLDRDGVVVEEVGYLHRIEDIRILPRVPSAIAALNRAGLPVILVTNQAGIGRGYYDWATFEATQTVIEEGLAREGATLDGVWACAYHPDGVGELARDHEFRKPHPGMVLDAAKALSVDLGRSWMVGDKLLDVECAQRAGLAAAVLVRTGYGSGMEAHLNTLSETSCRVFVCDDLASAVELILSEMGDSARLSGTSQL